MCRVTRVCRPDIYDTYCSVMTNLYASVSTAKPAPLVSTVSRGLDTVAISARVFLCYIVGLALLKGVFIIGDLFRRLVSATRLPHLLVVRGGLLGDMLSHLLLSPPPTASLVGSIVRSGVRSVCEAGTLRCIEWSCMRVLTRVLVCDLRSTYRNTTGANMARLYDDIKGTLGS